ncbi:MAG: hypothetical protein KAS05_01035 [Candidatus Omnitrophica bacterium]|nr:hypothetical protein [Candidatus Omnitrophota bacterium]
MQNTKLIYSGEKNPYALSSIARKYHDALKKRLQVFLALKHIPNLTRAQKEKIEGDMPTYSILNLMNFLKKAFPSEQTKIQNFLNKHETIIKRVKWVRDKSEHPLMQLWSMPGKIYEDRNEQPNSTKPPKDHLLYNFIIGVNNAVIDIYILLLDLDPVSRDEEQYKILNDFRVVS